MDPMATYDPSAPPSGNGKALAIVVGAIVLVVLLAGAAVFLLSSSGDDDGTEVAAEDQSDEPTEDTEVDEATTEDTEADAPDDTEVDDSGDPDGDGEENADDEDDDGDGVPDIEDEAPLDPDVPGDDADEPGDEDDGDDGEDTGEPTPSLDLLRNDPRPAVDGWLDAAGDGAKAVEVVLYTDYGIATIRDGEHPAKVRDLTWRDGSVDEGDLEDPFPGTDLEGESFRLSAVNWDALPGLVADAPARAHLPHGEVSHVIVTSDQPFSARKLFRIYVVSPDGRSAYVVATIDGHPAER